MAKEGFAKACKEHMLDEIKSRFEKSKDFFVTSYMGLTNAELELLRKNLKKSESSYFVVKNSLVRLVFDKRDLKDFTSMVDGGIGISFSGKDIVSTCRTLVIFTKDHNKLKIKGAYIEGQNVSVDRVKELANLPPKIVLIAQVVTGIKSPITGFVNVLGGVLRKFVYVVDAVKRSRESSAQEGAAKDAAA